MILIADSGGTKIDWCLIDGLEEIKRVKTSGFNATIEPYSTLVELIKNEVAKDFPSSADIESVFFYGAGCIGDAKEAVAHVLQEFFPASGIEVESDMLGASRGLCGTRKGLVCILGTGSNTCLYNGKDIEMSIPAMGYILGDEGSGAVLGRLLVSDVFKKQLPAFLCEKFIERYKLTLRDVLNNVYREEAPARFLASFTPFLLEHIEEPAIHRLVLNNFKSFFIRNITLYPDFHNMRINVTGSIGYYFRDVLKEAAESMDCTLGKITLSPMEGLIEYHCRMV